MPLPNFLCVGAQKAGTTTLYDVLKQHPEIYLPKVKEPHFFDEHYKKGVDWYEDNFFGNYKNQKAIGEITPAYLYIDDAPKRILETLGPQVKLIFIFRHPADRAYSHFLMSKFNGFEQASFEEVMDDKRMLKGDLSTAEKRRFSYKNRGYYGQQLKKYLEIFPRDNMHFILFEELVSPDKKETYAAILKFLNVKEHELNFNIKSNTAKEVRYPLLQRILLHSAWLSAMAKKLLPGSSRKSFRKKIKHTNQKSNRNQSNRLSAELRKLLVEEYYKDDLQLLEKLIGKDLSHWYS